MPPRRPAGQLELDLHPGWGGLPRGLRPMQPRAAAAPFDSAVHRFSPLWRGRRVIVLVEVDRARVLDARGRNRTALVPWAAALPGLVDDLPVALDALLVGGAAQPGGGRSPVPSGRGPVLLVLDLLVRAGRSVEAAPLDRRLGLLERLLPPSDRLVLLPAIVAEGRAVHATVVARGLAGTLARERRSPYLAGRRSGLWRRVAAGTPTGGPPADLDPVADAEDADAAGAGAAGAGAAGAAAGPVLRLIEQLRLAIG